jgi:hypothetical protein
MTQTARTPRFARRSPRAARSAPLVAVIVALAAAAPGCGPGGRLADRAASRLAIEKPPRPTGSLLGAAVYSKEILTETYTIDRIYKSMTGPMGTLRFAIAPGSSPELLWVTGFEAVMTAPDGETEMSREFMCHSNLSIRSDPGVVYEFPTALKPTGGRLFTLAQGQLSIHLPYGFGVPVMSNQTVQVAAQVLNHNIADHPFEVRHRITIEFVRDRDLALPLKPLMPRAVFGMKLIAGSDGYYALQAGEIDAKLHGEGCQVGVDAGTQYSAVFKDGQGRTFSGHWIVKPGREENHSLVTKLLALPYDTTLHYVAVHLHPFAESVELRDLTSGTTVYKSHARQERERIGLKEVEFLSSAEGIPLYKDHEYEVVSVYDNTSGVDQDAMATMFLYVAAKDLDLTRIRSGAVPSDGGTSR